MVATTSTTTNAPTQPINIETQADASGHWGLQINSNIAAGPHVVVVTDQAGNQAQAIMYVIKEQRLNRRSSKASGPPCRRALCMFFYCWRRPSFFLELVNLLLARKVDHSRLKFRKKYVWRVMLISIVMLFLVAGTGVWVNRETNFLQSLFPAKAVTLEKVSGQLINPSTLQPVSGADLQVGDTAIHVGESGQYIFGNVDPRLGIRATYPSLNRALVFFPDGKNTTETLNIYFDAGMYNVLIQAADDESWGKFADEYSLLEPSLQLENQSQ